MFDFLVTDVFDDVTSAIFDLYSCSMQRTQFSSDYFENYNLKYLYVYLGLILYLSFLRHPRLVKITVEITVENSNDIKFKTK